MVEVKHLTWKSRMNYQVHDLEPLDAFNDLGVVLSPELEHHIQVDAEVKKARNTAFLIRRVFRHLPTKVFLGTHLDFSP